VTLGAFQLHDVEDIAESHICSIARVTASPCNPCTLHRPKNVAAAVLHAHKAPVRQQHRPAAGHTTPATTTTTTSIIIIIPVVSIKRGARLVGDELIAAAQAAAVQAREQLRAGGRLQPPAPMLERQ
jgi:hypothetical protein